MVDIAKSAGADRSNAAKAKTHGSSKVKPSTNFGDHLAETASAFNEQEKSRKVDKSEKPDRTSKSKSQHADRSKDRKPNADVPQKSDIKSPQDHSERSAKCDQQADAADEAERDASGVRETDGDENSVKQDQDEHDAERTGPAIANDGSIPRHVDLSVHAADPESASHVPIAPQPVSPEIENEAGSTQPESTSTVALGKTAPTSPKSRATANDKTQAQLTLGQEQNTDFDAAHDDRQTDGHLDAEVQTESAVPSDRSSSRAVPEGESKSEQTETVHKTSDIKLAGQATVDPSLGSSPNPISPNATDVAKSHPLLNHQAKPDSPVSVPYSAFPVEIGLRSLAGAKEISIELTPRELGRVNVILALDTQSQVQVNFYVEQPQTLALLKHDAGHIRHALEQAGLTMTDSSLQFSMQNDTSSQSGFSQQERDASAPSPFAPKSHVSETDPIVPLPYQRVYLNHLDLSV